MSVPHRKCTLPPTDECQHDRAAPERSATGEMQLTTRDGSSNPHWQTEYRIIADRCIAVFEWATLLFPEFDRIRLIRLLWRPVTLFGPNCVCSRGICIHNERRRRPSDGWIPIGSYLKLSLFKVNPEVCVLCVCSYTARSGIVSIIASVFTCRSLYRTV